MFPKNGIGNEYAVYIHIPFCTKRCPYCDFYVRTDGYRNFQKFYETLFLEFRLRQNEYNHHSKPYSLYFGGGTPSKADIKQLQQIIQFWKNQGLSDTAEITLEANPEDYPKYEDIFHIGVNRISIGVQSFRDNTLTWLGRTHNSKTAIQAIETAKKVNFHSIGIDLICGLPIETTEEWMNSLKLAMALQPNHLSVYILSFYSNTAFGKRLQKNFIQTAEDQKIEQDYLSTIEILTQNGYEQYELSNFALPSFQSLHNLSYWQGRCYYGFGPSAHSYTGDKRYANYANFYHWQQSVNSGNLPFEFMEGLNQEKHRIETIAMNLRLKDGLNWKDERVQISKDKVDTLVNRGLAYLNQDFLCLTPIGFLKENAIISFLL